MLQCKNIVKEYYSGDEIVHAVNGLSVTFRDNEFVSILGPSGCGKTTFLNIIGGLDQYTSGDLIINGKSTKEYTDKDWDTYRNHRIGFIFQSYNLIMHQSVLKNVEMSLTLSGVPKEERKKRAIAALEKVGLKDQINKKPTQMSGGQMQRVAIARALVNDPEIVLADEPTGALDSETSVQIMELLKEIARDRLVIMVTHNPELAERYSTRIVRLKDGKMISDSMPVKEVKEEAKEQKLKRPSMSFWTALSLSFNNLMTKKGRTLLTSFAGSIGIIGIGLIMSLSNGVQDYITRVENDTMADYPIELKDNTMDMSVMMSAMMDMQDETEASEMEDGKITTSKMVESILDSISSSKTNNLAEFKKYLESDQGDEFTSTAKAIEYSYGMDMTVFNSNSDYGLVRVSPNELIDKLGFSQMGQVQSAFGVSSPMNQEIWTQMPDSQALREDNYQLIDGAWPKDESEILLAVDKNNEITDYALYSAGLLDQDELVKNYQNVLDGKTDKIEVSETKNYTNEDFIGMELSVLPNSALYQKVNGLWIDQSDNEDFIKDALKKEAKSVKIVGIVKPAEKTVSSTALGGILYDSSLRNWAADEADASEIVKEQKADPKINVFTGREFTNGEKFSMDQLTPEQMMQMQSMPQEELLSYITTYNNNINATYDSNLSDLGVIDLNEPSSIKLYARSFDDKEKLGDLITEYNNVQNDEGKPENIITYTDTVGVMLSGVQRVINLISYVLMGFVSVSLVVSSIMIGIITYISVLERIKEIGVLRALGASKRDIRRVFNAETFIIGLISGLLGIGITALLDIPISMIVQNLTGVAGIASLPVNGAVILVLINLALTMIAGLIPASMASRKNPVEALRTE
ncbi:ABC transporter ATP-binding protein/permease [uncultured Allobaculum sp.]|uniref:ABC transporter ATP-binding protein/permease n=2 Tax=uncultured Allobaculum sp. TaxID=1187017 RepID=UPI002587407C|nr:ABC transporter ATP-binding protein/permease [uncultured Allobaculum sp.]